MKNSDSPIDYYAPLHADFYYHVFNRTNNRELLFKNDENRMLFLEKLKEYLLPYLHIYAYCLMENHFHLLIRVKSIKEILDHVSGIDEIDQTAAHQQFLQMDEKERTVPQVVERQFTRWFTSYAMRYNRMWKRSGNLFHRPFKRVATQNEVHFTYLIYYIHANPVKHKVLKDFRNYRWSSYQAFLSDKPTSINRAEVLEWFGGREAFLEFPQAEHHFGRIDELIIED
jgi:putative transposase